MKERKSFFVMGADLIDIELSPLRRKAQELLFKKCTVKEGTADHLRFKDEELEIIGVLNPHVQKPTIEDISVLCRCKNRSIYHLHSGGDNDFLAGGPSDKSDSWYISLDNLVLDLPESWKEQPKKAPDLGNNLFNIDDL